MDRQKAARMLRRLANVMPPIRLRKQRRSLEAPGKSGDARAVARLCRALKVEWDLHRRDTAADVLAWLGEPATLPLCEALREAEAEVRWRAASALGPIRDERAVLPLCEALTDEHWRGRPGGRGGGGRRPFGR